MRVYKLQRKEGYAFVNFASTADYEISWTLKDRSLGDIWHIPNVTTVYENPEDNQCSTYKESDFLGVGHCIFSGRAIDILGKKLESYGEILPLKNANGPECYLFLAEILDALDLDTSVIKYFPNSETRIMAIRKYGFLADVIGDRLAFRLPDGPLVNFFTEPIIDLILQSKLKGVSSKLLWESRT